MQVKKIIPEESVFKYDPGIQSICIISQLKFLLNNEVMEFEIDQNPYGEPVLSKIHDIQINENYSQLSFNCIYRKRETKFVLDSQNEIDKLLYRLLVEIKNNSFNKDIKDTDSIDLIIRKDRINTIILYKDVDYKIIDSLRIILEGENYFLIKQKPYQKILLNSLEIDNNIISCYTENGDFSFKLDTQPFISDIISELLKVNFSQ